MRQWIDLCEAKVIDGFLSGLSYKEMKSLASERDLRGVAYKDKIYVADALDWVHNQMRQTLGIPPLFSSRDATPEGFDFYIGTESFGIDVADDRFDWFGLAGTEQFSDGEIVANTTETSRELALRNREFRRMMGPMAS